MDWMEKIRIAGFALVMGWFWLAANTASLAQNFWQQTGGPTGGEVKALTIKSTGEIFAGTRSGGIFRSTNNGDGWTAVNNGLTNTDLNALAINSSGHIFVGTPSGVFRSVDNGDSWALVNAGLTSTGISSFAVNISTNNIFAGTAGGGVFRSTNNGANWMAVNAGLTNTNVQSLAINSNGHIFAGTAGGIFRSLDNATSWIAINAGLSDTNVQSLALNSNGHIFAGTAGGIFRSLDNGNNWLAVNTGLSNTNVKSLVVDSSGQIFAGTAAGGVFRSMDNGSSWVSVLPNLNVEALTVNSSRHIFAGTIGGGVFRSQDNGGSWVQINMGLTNTIVRSLASNSSEHIFAGTPRGVFRSMNNGDSWSNVSSVSMNTDILALAINSSGHIFAGTGGGVFRSTDNGGSWTAGAGLPNTRIWSLAINNSTGDILAGTGGGGVFRSTDNGSNWVQINTGLTTNIVYALALNSSGHIFIGTAGGRVFRSTNNGGTWTSVNSSAMNTDIRTLAINPATQDIFAGTDGSGVFRSTDNGNSWAQINTGLTNTKVRTFAINPAAQDIFAGTFGDGVFRSMDNGGSWRVVNAGLTNKFILFLDINSSGFIFTGTNGNGVLRSVQLTTLIQPTVNLQFPNGGQNLNEDTPINISWQASDDKKVTRIQLLYSTNNRRSYTVIVDSTMNNGEYYWRIPRTPSDSAYVKIIAFDEDGLSATAVSNAAFMIQDVETYVHATGAVSQTIRNDGASGSESGTIAPNVNEPSLEFPPGSSNQYLFMNRLVLAMRTANGDTFATNPVALNTFRPSAPITVKNRGNEVETETQYQDKLGLRLTVEQRTIAFNNDPFVIQVYKIINRGATAYSQFYVGSYNDFDIKDRTKNLCGYDASQRLAYMFDATANLPGYAGIRLLDNNPAAFRRWKNGEDPQSQPAIFRRLATPSYDNTAADSPADYRILESSGPFTLSPGDSVTVAFAMAIGNGLAGLQTASQRAQEMWTMLTAIAPSVTTNSASNIAATSATLNGAVNPNGLSTTVKFEYGATTAYGSEIAATPSPVTGTSAVSVSAAISSLSPNTLYHYRVVGSNSAGTANGADQTFTTSSTNQAPLAPTLVSPGVNAFITNNTPALAFNVPADVNGDQLHFRVEIDDDGNFGAGTQTFESRNNAAGFNPTPPVAPGAGQVTYTVQSALADGDWWWRVSAWDGQVYGNASAVRRFVIDVTKPFTSNHDPAKGATGVPLNSNIVARVQDAASGVNRSSLVMKVNGNSVSPAITGIASNYALTYDPPNDFGFQQTVNVSIEAADSAGNAMATDAYSFITMSQGNSAPAAPTLASLPANAFTNDNTPALAFNVPSDPNGDQLHFKVEIDDDGNFGAGTQTYESRNNAAGFNPTPPVAPGTGHVTYTVQSALTDNDWFWRVSAWDGQVYGNSSEARRFIIDRSIPQISHFPATTATFNQNHIIQATLVDNFGIKTSMIYYRAGGASAFDSTRMSNTSGGTAYQGTVPSSAVTNRGVEYYFAVEDSAGNRRTFPPISNPEIKPQVIQVSNSNLFFANPSPVKAYRMISIPFDLNDKAVESVLGDDFIGRYDSTQWRLSRYVNGSNVEFGSPGFANFDFRPGFGFWLITKDAKNLDAGDGKSVSTAQNFVITLPPGWSQIGNPFAFTVNWSEVIKNGTLEGLVGYEGLSNEQEGYRYKQTQLAPFAGYFVNNKESSSTTIEIPPKAASGGATTKQFADWKSALQGNEWAIQITAECDRYLDKDNYLGALNDASDEWDANDFSEAPFFDQHVALYFPHPEWKKYPDLYTGDFRAVKLEGDYWDFVVRSEVAKSEVARSEVVLKLAEVQNLPADWEIVLLDKASHVAINFSEKKQYSFPSGNGKTVREFRIVVGKKDFVETNDLNLSGVPQAFALGQNYPNPFNPSTVISFQLPVTSNIKLSIYNLNGQLVRMLFEGEQSAGRYTVSWDSANANGNRVASGVYLVRMEVGPSTGFPKKPEQAGQGFVAVRKMVLVR